MSVKRLLQIIDDEAGAQGWADGKAVKQKYGTGFDQVHFEAIRAGYYDAHSPVGTIKLSPTGEYEARR